MACLRGDLNELLTCFRYDERAVQRARYMTLEIAPLSDDPFVSLPAMAS